MPQIAPHDSDVIPRKTYINETCIHNYNLFTVTTVNLCMHIEAVCTVLCQTYIKHHARVVYIIKYHARLVSMGGNHVLQNKS